MIALRPLRMVFVASIALAACSIEGSRQQGDECLMARECATGLRCEVTSSGVSRCVVSERFDVLLLPGVDATPEAAVDAPPPMEMPTPPPDVPAPPPDVPTPMDVISPDVMAPRDIVDVAPDLTDVAGDEAVTADAGADVASDRGADVGESGP